MGPVDEAHTAIQRLASVAWKLLIDEDEKLRKEFV